MTTTPKAKKEKPATWEHPKGSGVKLTRLENKTGGAVYGASFRVTIPSALLGRTDKREMRQFKTQAEAERFAEDRLAALRQHGTSFSELPPKAQKEAAIAWGMLSVHGLSFVEAAEAAIKALRPAGGQRTLAQVTEELRASKKARLERKELDQRTHDDFESRTLKIDAALGSRLVSTISGEDIAAWLRQLRTRGVDGKGPALAQRSVLNYRNTLAEVFRHAKARRYCAENPLEFFTREDYKALGGEKAERDIDGINILKVAEAEKLLTTAETREDLRPLLPSLVLRLFCGLRTAEICRLEWSEVRWTDADPFVHIPAGKAKKRRVRLVEIPANALAWLKAFNPPASGLIVPGNGKVKGYCKRFSRLVTEAGLSDWGNNDTRHSFASYHYALLGDAVKTSALMGHKQGDDVLFSHYRTLVSKAEAAQFFGLMPNGEAGKVVEFPQAVAR